MVHQLHDEVIERFGNGMDSFARSRNGLGQVGKSQRRSSTPMTGFARLLVRAFTDEQSPEHDSQRVEIGSMVNRASSADLLRGHVSGGTDGYSLGGEARLVE